jgi:glycerophosphoryl diester phosphodiesterase
MKTHILAHRGASAYLPENTMEAFSLAIEQGADGFELDVHLTKDGEIVVAHDEKLERVSNGNGFLNDYTLDELKSLDFGRLQNHEQEKHIYRIPTLAEVFSLVKPAGLTLNIEMKTDERIYMELPEKLAALTKEYSMEDYVIYSSFNHYFLQLIKKIEPAAKTGLLYDLALVDPLGAPIGSPPWVYAKYTGAYAIHPNYRIIAALPETVAKCHENGIKVNVWTVDDPQIIKLMLEYGVDCIMTNKPDIAIACRENN